MRFGRRFEAADLSTWGWTLGRIFGIEVRLHWLYLLFTAGTIFRDSLFGSEFVLRYTLPGIAILFAIVLLHEFGHCFGCRAVGGSANEILMWPLGGLAYTAPPHRPWEHLMTTLAGPAVNVVIMMVLTPILFAYNVWSMSFLLPFADPFANSRVLVTTGLFYVGFAFQASYWILLFNLLPFYPFDGGRILQEILWFRIGYVRATYIAARIGIVGGALLGIYGIVMGDIMLVLIAVFGAMQCYQILKRSRYEMEADRNEFGYDFSQGYTSLNRTLRIEELKVAKPTLLDRYKAWKAKRSAKKQVDLEAELDRILDKINEKGLTSLTDYEKRLLTDASKRKKHGG